MARKCYMDDVEDKKSLSNMKKIGMGVSALILAGCSTIAPVEPLAMDVVTNKVESSLSQLGNTNVENSVLLVESINKDNYKDILDNKLSGAYKHPVYDNQVATIKFEKDKNADNNIISQFSQIGISPDSYSHANDSLKDGLENGKSSMHIPYKDYVQKDNIDQIHLSYIMDSDYKKTPLKDFVNDRFNGYESGSKEEYYGGYRLMMHEIGHSLEELQLETKDKSFGVMDEISFFFDKTPLIKAEVGAEIFGTLKTIKLMSESGETKDYIENQTKADVYSAKISLLGENRKGMTVTPKGEDSHQYMVSASVINELVKTNLDDIVKLDDKGIKKLTVELAEMIVSEDYSEMYKDTMVNKIKGNTKEAMKEYTNDFDLDSNSRMLKYYENEKKEGNSMSNSSQRSLKILKELDNYSKINPEKDVSEGLDEMSRNVSSKLIEEAESSFPKSLKISDFNNSLMGNIKDFGSIKDKIVEKMNFGLTEDNKISAKNKI